MSFAPSIVSNSSRSGSSTLGQPSNVSLLARSRGPSGRSTATSPHDRPFGSSPPRRRTPARCRCGWTPARHAPRGDYPGSIPPPRRSCSDRPRSSGIPGWTDDDRRVVGPRPSVDWLRPGFVVPDMVGPTRSTAAAIVLAPYQPAAFLPRMRHLRVPTTSRPVDTLELGRKAFSRAGPRSDGSRGVNSPGPMPRSPTATLPLVLAQPWCNAGSIGAGPGIGMPDARRLGSSPPPW